MEACTLYCKIKPSDFQSLVGQLKILSDGLKGLDVHEASQEVTCQTQVGSVKFVLQTFQEPGDLFSRLVGKTYIYFESKSGNREGEKILSHLDQTEAVIGIVANPSLNGIDQLEALVLFLSAEFNAMIFNGEEMLDAAGEVVE